MNIIPKDSDRAVAYLDKLSKFYRYSVGKHEEALVYVEDEIQNARLYADLLRERFGDNIRISINNGLSKNAKVIPLSLQLLIENAVKHNVVSSKKPLQIDVFADQDGDYIHVKNNRQRKIQEVHSTGVGLKNIRERFAYFTDLEVMIVEDNTHFDVAIPVILN
jgi:LytS/YehU family sensor histidine kinase